MRLKCIPSSSRSVETSVISLPESIIAASSPIPETVEWFTGLFFPVKCSINLNFPSSLIEVFLFSDLSISSVYFHVILPAILSP